jgi:argonaute-like protein implicated in RNA metabolism and viral defense
VDKFENLRKYQEEEMMSIIRLFKQDKSADLFIVNELSTRLKEFLKKIKRNYENLVQKKKNQIKSSKSIQKSLEKEMDNPTQILKKIVEDINESEESEKSKESDKKSQVFDNDQ